MRTLTASRWIAVLAAVALVPAVRAEERGSVVKVVKPVKVVVERDERAVSGGYLGVRVEEAKRDERGALIVQVIENSPAEKAGLRDADVIVAFDGKKVSGPADLTERIRRGKPGDKVSIEIMRDGTRREIAAELGARVDDDVRIELPGDEDEYSLEIPLPDRKQIERELRVLKEHGGDLKDLAREMRDKARELKRAGRGSFSYWTFVGDRPLLGVELVETTPELREFLGGNRDAGVLIGRVLPGSAAERTGVRVGDLLVAVDGEKISGADELIEAVREREGKTIELELVRDRKKMNLKVDLPSDEKEPAVGPRARLGGRPARQPGIAPEATAEL